MRRRGGSEPSYVVRFMNLALCGDFTVFEACATSKLCILGIQHMFGPHAKRWWLSSRTHLSGYQRYRCFPSVGPRGHRRCMHHFNLHQKRLINFTIKEDSFWVVLR